MLIVYHHILKTGGTAIDKWMQNTMRREGHIMRMPAYSTKQGNVYIHNHIKKNIEIFNDYLMKPEKHIISIRDPIKRQISKMNFAVQQGYEDWYIDKNDQYEFLERAIPQMHSYEFIRQEFHQEDFNRAFENDVVINSANVTKVKEYSWDTMSEKEKDQLRKKFEPEYSMLKSLGIEYNIP